MSANLFGNFLTVATIPLLILLLIIYYSKDQFNNVRTKIFKILLYVLLVSAITEVIWTLSMNYKAPMIFLEFISRLHFIGEILWWYIFELYLFLIFRNPKEINDLKGVIKYNLFTKALTIYNIIIFILVAVVPQISTVKNVDINRIEYMPKHVLFLTIPILGVVLIMAIIYLIKYESEKLLINIVKICLSSFDAF